MTDPKLMPYVLRFARLFGLLLIAAYFIIFAISVLAPDLVPWITRGPVANVLSVLIIITPSILVGQSWGRKEHAPMPPAAGWILAGMLAVVTLVLSVVALAVLVLGNGYSDAERAIVQRVLDDRSGMIQLIGIMCAVLIVIHRLSLWGGVLGVLRQQPKSGG